MLGSTVPISLRILPLFHIFIRILANDPPYQIEERVESRIDAIRKCLIHALSNTPTSKDDQKYLIGTETRQFEFIAYAPQAFEDLMALWNKHVPKLQLLNSLKKGELRQISNPNGRLSNVDIFIKTADQLFFIKDVKTGKEMLTVKDQKANRTKPKAELDFFWKHFKSYCVRMEEEFKFYGQQSLLPKFFALFGIKDNSYWSARGRTNLPAIKRYPKDGKNPTFRFLDLYDETEKKTSEANRAMLKEKREGCFFRNGILLEDDVYTKFIGILARDALFLKESGRTDYSLLLGVIFEDLSKRQMELLQKDNANILVTSCEDCSRDRGQTYSNVIENIVIIPGIIDILAQFNWRKKIDLVNRVVVKHETEKKAKSAIAPEDFYFRFMCAVATKVFRPRTNQENQLETSEKAFCGWLITEPKFE
ncbi:hypothetical protein GPALN_010417 [Globodera pallida]|nr:hypothetical protein GPALN_010417 [Globodera pallida]